MTSATSSRRGISKPTSKMETSGLGSMVPPGPDVGFGLEEKVRVLEETLRTFRAEVDLKMTIMEQILTTRSEQFVVQKKLLEREQCLYESVLAHWANTPQLAASGLSLKFSSRGVELDMVSDESGVDPEDTSLLGKRHSASSPKVGVRRKRQRMKSKLTSGRSTCVDDPPIEDSSGDSPSPLDDDNGREEVDHVGLDSDKGTDDEGDGLEEMVFVNFYSVDKEKPGKWSSNPIWRHFLREQHARSAMCKLCDKNGIQKILKLQDGGTSGLHRHLKFAHKEQCEGNNSIRSVESLEKGVDPVGARDSPSPLIPQKTESGVGRGGQQPKKSLIWTYFTKLNDGEGAKVRCNLCHEDGVSTIYKNSDSSTSSYHRHLKKTHGLELSKQQSLDSVTQLSKVIEEVKGGAQEGMQVR